MCALATCCLNSSVRRAPFSSVVLLKGVGNIASHSEHPQTTGMQPTLLFSISAAMPPSLRRSRRHSMPVEIKLHHYPAPAILAETFLQDYASRASRKTGLLTPGCLPEPNNVGFQSDTTHDLIWSRKRVRMATQSGSALQRLSTLASTLNRTSDDLSKQLAEIETALSRLNLGVTARVRLSTREVDSGINLIEEIGYAKVDGKWGLTWLTYYDHDPEGSWSEKLLREAPRDVRLLAVEVLPQLLDELALQGENLASKTGERVADAKKIAASLKG